MQAVWSAATETSLPDTSGEGCSARAASNRRIEILARKTHAGGVERSDRNSPPDTSGEGCSARAASNRRIEISAGKSSPAVWSAATETHHQIPAARAAPPEPQATGALKFQRGKARRRCGAQRQKLTICKFHQGAQFGPGCAGIDGLDG